MKIHTRTLGFSLTELAFILAIVGVVAGVTISTGKVQYDYATVTSTSNKLDTIREALLTFKKKTHRLPCPAPGNVAPTDATYGVEAASCDPASCPSGMTCTADNMIIGTVPFASIGMNAEAALDSWDNRVTYAVDYSHVTNSGSGHGRISVRDISGNEITASSVFGKGIFVLVSHGKNGNGAWSEQGTAVATCTVVSGADDIENCDGDSVFASSTINTGDINTNYYDDVVLWHAQGRLETDDVERIDYIRAENNNTCIILSNGRASCIGLNDNGQLGVGDTTDRSTFTELSGGFEDWKMVAFDAENACGIRGDLGVLYCWGDNANGELGINSTTDQSSPTPVVPESGSNTGWTKVDIDASHACGIRDGHLLCWGSDADGKIGDNTTAGSSSLRPREVQNSHTDWIDVGIGDSHSCGIRDISGEKRAYCWGEGANGRLGNGGTVPVYTLNQVNGGYTDWAAIESNNDHTCGLRENGELWCWGLGTNGQLGDNGTSNRLVPVRVRDTAGTGYWTDWVDFSVGGQTTCGVRSNGELYCWGSENGYEMLGNGAGAGIRDTPSLVSGGFTDWIKVSIGGHQACAIRGNGNMYCWGKNNYAQNGNTSTASPTNAPTLVTAY